MTEVLMVLDKYKIVKDLDQHDRSFCVIVEVLNTTHFSLSPMNVM